MQTSSANKIYLNPSLGSGAVGSSGSLSSLAKPDAVKFNLRSEVYPDPYSHITVTCLEYPSAGQLGRTSPAANSALQSRAKRFNRRNNVRYMTQPVTLIEIKETEEDTASFTPTPAPSLAKTN